MKTNTFHKFRGVIYKAKMNRWKDADGFNRLSWSHTHRIINNSTSTPPPVGFYTAHLSCLHKWLNIINQDFNHLMFKSAPFEESRPLQTVNICKRWKQDARVQSGAAPLISPPTPTPTPSLHVSPCLSKTAVWQITCVGGPPCSCPAVRPPLINAQAGARAVWQHKTNNATTQPSLLLTEMQPTALFRPLWLHSAPCTRPSGPLPPPTAPPHLHLPVLLHQTLWVFFCRRSRRILAL